MSPSSTNCPSACSALLLAALLAGCAPRAPWATASEVPKERRHPDGVVIDPVSAPPPAEDRARAQDGMVTLKTPLGVDRALGTIDELFRRVVDRDGDALEALFAQNSLALGLTPQGMQGQTPSALLWWQNRFRRLDYARLKGEVIYREAELRIFRAEDAAEAPPHPSIHADAMSEGDMVIEVPILTTHAGADRLFGDEIIFWLRRDKDRYRIYRVLEDFQLN
jgi:hypothetical protein